MSPRARIVLAAVIFSTGGAAIKAADLTAWQVASFRSAIAALTLLLVVPGARKHFGWRPAMVGVAYAATLILFVLATRLTTSANAIYLQSTDPVYLLLLGPWLLREPIRSRDIPVIIAVLGGLLLVFLGADVPSVTAPDPARGNILAVTSGVTYAFLLVGLRWLGKQENGAGASLAAVVMGNIFAALIALPMALPVGAHEPQTWLLITYLGAFQIAGAYLLVAKGLREVPALEASLLLLVETAINPVWSWMLLGEAPSGLALAGGGVIIGATAVQAIRAGRSPEPQSA